MSESGQSRRSSAEQFSPLAADYARSDYHARGPDLALLRESAHLGGKERVLDVGCGPGHAGLTLADAAASVVGIDPSPAMLAEASRLASERGVTNAEWVVGYAENLPWPDGSFERVVTRKTVHHWPEPQAGLYEIARVLAPGGRLISIDTLGPDDPECAQFLHEVETLRDSSHVRNHSVGDWSRMLVVAGLVLDHVHLMEQPIVLTDWLNRARPTEEAAAKVRAMMADPPQECRRRFHIDDEGNFRLPYGLLVAKHDPVVGLAVD